MSVFVLKLVAIIGMLFDHIGAVFATSTPVAFRYIGRMVFPVFAYMIAQGCKQTKSIYKYLLRLGIFAIISEVFFDIALMSGRTITESGAPSININFISNTNVFYTLFLGVACIAIYEKIKADLAAKDTGKSKRLHKLLPFLSMVPLVLLGDILGTDYGSYGILLIVVLYFAKPENKITRSVAIFGYALIEYGYPLIYRFCYERGIGLFILPGQMIYWNPIKDAVFSFAFALIAVPLVFLYNGKQGIKAKWFFYIFYPAHLAVLAALWYFFA